MRPFHIYHELDDPEVFTWEPIVGIVGLAIVVAFLLVLAVALLRARGSGPAEGS